MWENVIKPILILIIATTILIGTLSYFAEKDNQKRFNNGLCQVCGEDVLPIGHTYSTDYYCEHCKRFNK